MGTPATARKDSSAWFTGGSPASEPASLYAFDVLAIGGLNLRERPLLERKERLAEIVDGARGVHYVEHLEAHGEALFAKVCAIPLPR